MLLGWGAWGLFGMAALDGAGVPLPGVLDGTLAYESATYPGKAWLFALAMAAGSTLGCLVLYAIGYEGGEVLLRKRMNPAKFEKVRASFEKHPVIALGLPAMLPPPFPFKAMVFAAAVFEMRFVEFVTTIFVGRAIRFGIIAALAAIYGERIMNLAAALKPYGIYIMVIVALAAAVFILARYRRREETVA